MKGVWKSTTKNREGLKSVYIKGKKKVNGKFGRKMNQDVNSNWKLFWKDVSIGNGGKVENSNRIKD